MKQQEFDEVMALAHRFGSVADGETYDKIVKALFTLLVFCIQEQPHLKDDTVQSMTSILYELTHESGELH